MIRSRAVIATALLLPTFAVAARMPTAGAAQSPAPIVAQAQPAVADFGTPPAGAVPILFNDRHVYAAPSSLQANRVLAALVRGGTILVPLRSLFEQMGAVVTYDPVTRQIDVAKPGSDIKLTVGRPEVNINGETRPLDVPPEIDGNTLMVPIRVLSEGLGAYVQWVPEKRLVVVRYNAAVPTPEPTQIPTPQPTVPPASTPTPTAAPEPKRERINAFVAGDATFGSKIYNELVPGVTGKTNFDVKGALEIPFGPTGLMIGGDFRQYRYDHHSNFGFVPCSLANAGSCSTVIGNDFNYRAGTCPAADPGCVTVIGHGAYERVIGKGQAYVPAFTATDRDFDARVGLRVAPPRIYIAAGYLGRTFDYLGYPAQHGFGVGLDKLPDLDAPISIYGNIYYYPSVKGTYTGPTSTLLGTLSGATFDWSYRMVKYEIGVTYVLGRSPLFVEAGFAGDHGTGRVNAPADFQHTSVLVGGGIHL